jgi:hypothetical protein
MRSYSSGDRSNTGCPPFQSGDECINENNAILIGITWDADRDAPPFKAGKVHSKICLILVLFFQNTIKNLQKRLIFNINNMKL